MKNIFFFSQKKPKISNILSSWSLSLIHSANTRIIYSQCYIQPQKEKYTAGVKFMQSIWKISLSTNCIWVLGSAHIVYNVPQLNKWHRRFSWERWVVLVHVNIFVPFASISLKTIASYVKYIVPYYICHYRRLLFTVFKLFWLAHPILFLFHFIFFFFCVVAICFRWRRRRRRLFIYVYHIRTIFRLVCVRHKCLGKYLP